MNMGKAVAIFEDIGNEKYTVQEKREAIKMVANMETHNGIAKKSMVKALKWLTETEVR